MNDTTRELGGALGVALFGSIVAGQYASGIADRLAALPASVRDLAGTSLSTAVGLAQDPGRFGLELDAAARRAVELAGQHSFLDGFHAASLLGAAALGIASLLVFRLLPPMQHDPRVAADPDGDAAEPGPAAGPVAIAELT